jgi:hypothetical protein
MTAFRHGTLSLDYHDSGSGPLTLVLLPGWCEQKPFLILLSPWRNNNTG